MGSKPNRLISNQEALAKAGERIRKLLRKRIEDRPRAKKWRRQLRELGYFLSREPREEPEDGKEGAVR